MLSLALKMFGISKHLRWTRYTCPGAGTDPDMFELGPTCQIDRWISGFRRISEKKNRGMVPVWYVHLNPPDFWEMFHRPALGHPPFTKAPDRWEEKASYPTEPVFSSYRPWASSCEVWSKAFLQNWLVVSEINIHVSTCSTSLDHIFGMMTPMIIPAGSTKLNPVGSLQDEHEKWIDSAQGTGLLHG